MIRFDSEARRGFPGNEFKIITFISEISYDLDLFARLSPVVCIRVPLMDFIIFTISYFSE